MIQKKIIKHRMRFTIQRLFKFGLFALILFNFCDLAKAQPVFFNGASGTTSNTIPLSSTSNKVQWIYGPTLFNTAGATGTPSPSGLITKIYFRLGTTVNSSANYTDFTISLGQNQGKNTTWSSTTYASGLTQVFYASSFTMTGATSSSWYGITLNTPFAYDPSLSLVFDLRVASGTGNHVSLTTAGGNQRNFGTFASSSGTIGAGLVDFGFDLKPSQNDLSVLGITGLSNTCGLTSDPVFVQIRNTGIVDIAAGQNIPVRTVVTGGGSATLSRPFNKALKVGVTDTIHIGNLNTAAMTGAVSLRSFITYSLDSVRYNDTNVTARSFLGSKKVVPDYTFTFKCDSVKFTNATKDACNSITGYRWDFDNGKTSTIASPSHSYASAGSYNVKFIVFYLSGFKDSIIKQVVINPKPQANFFANNQCFGTNVDFNNFSTNSISYRWSFGDATTSTLTTPSRLYTAAGTYAVKLVSTNANGCRDSISKNIIVFARPTVNFTVNNSCAGSNTFFNNTSTGGSTFSWDFGDGTSSNYFSPGKIYTIPQNYGITLTVTSAQGCSNSLSKSVTIFSLPVAGFNVKNNCLGPFTSITNTSTGAVSYLWDFGDNTTSSANTPGKIYYRSGTFNVSLTAISSTACSNTIVKQVSIFENPVSDFSAPDVCIGLPTNFTNLSSIPTGGSNVLWKFGDGNSSVQPNPSNTYATAGPFDVRLITTTANGCKDSAESRINVYDKPKPTFTANDVCEGKAVQFINTSVGVSTQTWDFGDGVKDNTFSPSHTYANPGSYKVILTGASPNKCVATSEVTITVRVNPEIVFFTSNHCHGTEAIFSNQSVGAATFTWKFGDGDSTKTVQATHTYVNPGTYSVRLRGVSAKGCISEKTTPITVYPRPVPAFKADTVCHGLTTQFVNSSTGASSYNWNFGDGGGSSTANTPTYQYTNPGNYKVILTATSSDNCKQDLSKIIVVAPLPIPIFLVQDVCNGIAVKPTNTSQGVITSQKWNFGDGATDASKSPTHTYASAGIYTIQLKVSTGIGCSDSTSKTILIYTQPSIKISQNVSVSKGNSTQLVASGGTDYLWSPAATLNNASIPNPIATPQADTRYNVKVMNAFGCFDTASVNVSLLDDFSLVPANLITPNENGQNDKWVIKGIEFYPKATVMVFDMWGRIILTEENYKNTWDGTMKGKALPDGTYFYVITLPETERQYKGTINILRN